MGPLDEPASNSARAGPYTSVPQPEEGSGGVAVPVNGETKLNVVEKGQKESGDSEKKVSVFEVFRYADRCGILLMVFGGFAAVVLGGSVPAFSFLLGDMINGIFSATDPEGDTAKMALIMFYVGLSTIVICSIYVGFWIVAAARQVAVIRTRYFETLLRQDIGWHDQHSSGSLTARLTGDMLVFQNGINDKVSQGITNISSCILGVSFSFFFSWELSLVLLGVVPLIAMIGILLAKVMTRMSNVSRDHFAEAGAIATEVMENVRTVQSFGREDHEVNRFHAAVKSAQKAGIKKELTSSLTAGIAMAIIYLMYTVGFFFGSYLIQWGRRNVGEILACIFSLLFGSFGIGSVSSALSAFVDARVAAYKFFDTIDRTPEIDVNASGEPVKGFFDSIEFQDVEFTYPTRRSMKLFTSLSIRIKRGQKVAFSGASGCGKSSIIGLIQRFYDPTGGSILVDGKDLRSLALTEWRDQIGVVSQEPNLFAGTIMENVRFGRLSASEEEVIEACKKADIHDTVMNLPEKYNTSVGVVGSQLSGGQKQRLAIARAIVKRPYILLLDEATSALDRSSEVEVQAAIDNLITKDGMTVIMVAHRLATIRNMDCIYCFSYDGVKGSRIEEVGTFEELLRKNGIFAAMARAQGLGGAGSPTAQQLRGGGSTGTVSNTFFSGEEFKELEEDMPQKERQKVPLEELAKWEVDRANSSLWRVIKLSKEHIGHVMLGVLGSIITGGSSPTSGILMGKLLSVLGSFGVDHDIEALRRDINTYVPLFIALAASTFIGWGLHSLYGYAGEHLTTKLRLMLFRQILRQDMTFFDIPGRDAGTLAAMLSGDCEAVHQLFGPSIGLKMQTFCTISVGVVVAFFFQWKLALLGVACLPFVVMSNVMQQKMAMGFVRKRGEEASDSLVSEVLSNIRTVTSFNLKDNRSAIYREFVSRELSKEIKKAVVVSVLFGFTHFVFYAAFALCFWYGGKLIASGEATFQEVMIASMSVLLGSSAAGEAGSFASKMADAGEAAKRVFSVIDRVPDVDVKRGGDTEIGKGCDIVFRKVKFIYPARPLHPVLRSVDLNLRDGTTNGLIGQTGCGKSTIIQMLARFYESCGGVITVNGKDIRSLDIPTWRKNISIVMQEPDLFDGTVRDNICYSHPSATDDEVEEAARLACIHDDIVKWSAGYNTQVGYRGRALSGGQKQRVAIARGFLRHSRLILLDEATSALDSETEAQVQTRVDEYQKRHHVTIISIAHRLTTIRHSDQITLLDNGQILETGNHEDLMSLNGDYKKRWKLYTEGSI